MSDLANVIDAALNTRNDCPNSHKADNVVDGLFAIAEGLQAVARSLHKLGVSDACTGMGALEVLSKEVHDGLEKIAVATSESEH